MSAHFFCEAFTEIEGKVAVNDGLVYLILSSPDGNSDLHITINPLLAKILGEVLVNAMNGLRIEEVRHRTEFGNLMINVEDGEDNAHETKAWEESKIMPLPERPVA